MPGIVGIVPVALGSIQEMARSIIHKEWQISATREGWGALGCVDLKEPTCAVDPEGFRFGFLYGRPYEKAGDGRYKLIDSLRCMDLYCEKGIEAFSNLDGAFVFTICDDKAKEVIVVTDRYGLRPVYYRFRDGDLIFASEIKALLLKDEMPELDKIGLAEYFLYRGAIGERTLYKGIKVLPPAAILKYNEQTFRISKYWEFHYAQDTKKDERRFVLELEEALTDVMRDRLKSCQRPVILLSGGLDSRTLVAAGGDEKFDCTTFGLPGCDEISIAKEVAISAHKNHLIIEYGPQDLVELATEPLQVTDGQNTILTSYLPFVFNRMRENYDVFFNALAGDLILGGNFLKNEILSSDTVNALWRAIEKKLLLFDHELLNSVFEDSFLSSNEIKEARAELRTAIRDGREDIESYPNHADRFFLNQYVRRVTIMGSVVSRNYLEEECPTYDLRLLNVVFGIPPKLRARHRLYRKFLMHLSPELAAIRYQKTMFPARAPLLFWKIGRLYQFGLNTARRLLCTGTLGNLDLESKRSYVDYKHWLRKNKGWRRLVSGTLLDERTTARGIFKRVGVERLLKQHERGMTDHSIRLAYLTTLELLLRALEDRNAEE